MATEVVVAESKSLPQRVVTFYHDVMAEMKKVTWPDLPQVQPLSIGVIVLSLFIVGVSSGACSTSSCSRCWSAGPLRCSGADAWSIAGMRSRRRLDTRTRCGC